MTLIHTPTGAIVCDHMPVGLALVTVRKDGIYRHFVPHVRAKRYVVTDADVELTDDSAVASMSSAIPGYSRLP
jgi:hypothetical protein